MTTIALANRLRQIQPSATLSIGARINQLKAQGKDIINLTVGEPDFDTPENIKEAARRALKNGFTKYTAVDGIPSLKEAIISKFARENKLNYESKQIIVTNGAKQAIYNLAQALLNPGDEVIIPAPYWVSYPEMMLLAEAKPVFIPTTLDQHFKINAEQLEKAITPRTRLLIINSPSNPSGMAYSKNELEQLAKVLIKHPKIFIASDDIYEHILWTKEPFVNILNACPELYGRTIVINGVSKSYAMTGWRIGYAAGPREIIAAMSMIQSQSTSNPNSIAQVAAQEALTGDQQFLQTLCESFKKRHEIVYKGLQTIKSVKCLPVDGTFYTFPQVQAFLDKNSEKIDSDIKLVDYLVDKIGVALIPGSPFGAPGHLRLSFVTNIELLEEAIRRLKTIL